MIIEVREPGLYKVEVKVRADKSVLVQTSFRMRKVEDGEEDDGDVVWFVDELKDRPLLPTT